MNLIYEYPFEIDVEETDFWTNTEFNKSVLRCQTTKERKKKIRYNYNVFQNTTNYKTSEGIQENYLQFWLSSLLTF